MNKDFKLNKEKLTEENKKAFDKINFRLIGKDLHPKAYKNNINEILNMLLEGQERQESYKDIIGEDLDLFCDSIIENSYKTTVYERIFRLFYLSNLAIVLPSIIVLTLVSLLVKENIFLIIFSEGYKKIDASPFIIIFCLGIFSFYFIDLRSRTSLKGKWIRNLVFFLSLFELIFRNIIFNKLEINTNIYVNKYLLLFISLFILISYKIYDFIILKKIER